MDEWLVLGAVSASALANAVTAYLLWRGDFGPEVRVVHLSPVADASFSGDAAGDLHGAVGSSPASGLVLESRLRRNRDDSSGLKTSRGGRGSKKVVGEDSAGWFRHAVAAIQGATIGLCIVGGAVCLFAYATFVYDRGATFCAWAVSA